MLATVTGRSSSGGTFSISPLDGRLFQKLAQVCLYSHFNLLECRHQSFFLKGALVANLTQFESTASQVGTSAFIDSTSEALSSTRPSRQLLAN